MAQCEQVLDDGRACTNSAVPGSHFCEQHRRLEFRPVNRLEGPPRTTPQPSARTSSSTNRRRTSTAAAQPTWVVRPANPETAPSFPGLHTDARDIVVAPHGIVWLEPESPGMPAFARLGRLLCTLSEVMPLARHTQVRTTQEGGLLLVLTPPDPDAADVSRVYDSVASAAALNGTTLYIGDEHLFIEYRDGRAPRGYDGQGVQAPVENVLYFVSRESTRAIPRVDLSDLPLAEVLLRLRPQLSRSVELPAHAFVMATRPLYGLLSRYLRAHRLGYRVGQVHVPNHGTMNLFELSHRQDAPKATLPAFVLSYLARLPRCVVLIEVDRGDGRQILVEWRHRLPGVPRHMRDVFSSDSAVLFTAHPEYPNLCLTPMPTLYEGDQLLSANAGQLPVTVLQPPRDTPVPPLHMPVTLVPEHGTSRAIAAVLLTPQELKWLRGLLLRLPGSLFDAYSICIGEELAVLMTESTPIQSLPMGVPLRRVQDSQLFIPIETRVSPDLPVDILARTFELQADRWTFVTHDRRVDLPRGAFALLSRHLFAMPDRPRVAMTLRLTPDLPTLEWQPPGSPATALSGAPTPARPSPAVSRAEQRPQASQGRTTPDITAAGTTHGAAGNFLNAVTRFFAGRSTTAPASSPAPAPLSAAERDHDIREQLHAQAVAFRESGDHLKAAVCFELAGDDADAGRCYERMARAIGSDTRAESPVR